MRGGGTCVTYPSSYEARGGKGNVEVWPFFGRGEEEGLKGCSCSVLIGEDVFVMVFSPAEIKRREGGLWLKPLEGREKGRLLVL